MRNKHEDQERQSVQIVTGVCLVMSILMLAGIPVFVKFFQF